MGFASYATERSVCYRVRAALADQSSASSSASWGPTDHSREDNRANGRCFGWPTGGNGAGIGCIESFGEGWRLPAFLPAGAGSSARASPKPRDKEATRAALFRLGEQDFEGVG